VPRKQHVEAAETYAKTPGALQLRAMNLVYEEVTKELSSGPPWSAA
jgi:hypothetical protein